MINSAVKSGEKPVPWWGGLSGCVSGLSSLMRVRVGAAPLLDFQMKV